MLCAVAIFAVVSLTLEALWCIHYAFMQQLRSGTSCGVVEQFSVTVFQKWLTRKVLFLLSISV